MKFEVHWPEPSVLVCTPGWIEAVLAGAQAEAEAGMSAMAATAATNARRDRRTDIGAGTFRLERNGGGGVS